MRRTCWTTLLATIIVALPAQSALAASVTSNGTDAVFTGLDVSDDVDVSTVDADTVRFDVAGGDAIVEGGTCTQVDADTTDCDATRVRVDAAAGEDTVDAENLTAQKITLNGGPDADAMLSGELDDALNGGPGEDIILLAPNGPGSTAGDDRVDGGGGDDLIAFPAGADDVVGGTGLDRVIFFGLDFDPPGTADVSFTLDDQANDGPAGDANNVHGDVEALTAYLTTIAEAGVVATYYVGPTTAGEGKATLRGNDAPNTLVGGTQADDIDGAAGNDSLLGGDGDDTLRGVDGYADQLKCGPGNDTAIADTLDVVSDSCETVERSDAGNANDVPEVPEDLPPAVTFDAPAPGALTTGVTTLRASATDDRGVAAVLFYDDDRIVCNDTAAPYTCDYQPRGEDVGRNTVSVMAVDTAQQTATAFRVFAVPRFAPAKLSLKVTPARDATAPFRFRATGKVTLPAQVAPALGCAGSFVAIQVKAGGTTISNRRVRLKADCTFSSTVSFRSRKRFRTRRALRVYAVFAGNAVLGTLRSATTDVRVR